MERNGPCWCGSGKKWKKCHYPEKPGLDLRATYKKKYGILLKDADEVSKIEKACETASSILLELCDAAKKGVTTFELDQLSTELHKKKGAKPAALHYGSPPFPFGICTSINEEICHGFPRKTPLKKGDIVNIDVASIVDGYYGDCSAMVIIDETTEERQKVVDTSYEALMEAIKICKPGTYMEEIGEVIESVAKKNHCSVVNQFVGHGVGKHFHEPPQVCHHRHPCKIAMAPGMTFTIEPMINAGKREAVLEENNWTALTIDKKPSAQWEHTILITESGHRILTKITP